MIRSWMTQVDFNCLLLPLATPPTEPSLPLGVGRRPGQCSRRKRLSATQRKSNRSPDDYHATIRALNSRGRRPTKSLGQHYMLNSDINERLAAAADVGEGDVVLEIGPGTGSLTHVLVGNGASVLAVEKDPHMAAIVSKRFVDSSRLKVVQEDFVRCRIASHINALMQSTPSGNGGESRLAKVVANVPFNITKDIIRYLLPMGDVFSEVALLLQEETALRITKASPCTSQYRPINVFVNFYSEPRYEFHVPRSNFFPQPNVDAAVVTFKLKQTAEYPDVMSRKSFFSMVNSAFSGKRKMLRKSLQHICTALEIEEALDNVGLPVTSRPEELTVDDFVNFYNKLVKVQPTSSSPVGP